jgi:NAD(P)-dependent dehydrogenase (short-subunit alcohol dehydrogenase family)
MLLRKNCTVWIAGRSASGFDEAKKTISSRPDVSEAMVGRLYFHKLDLAEMKHAEASGQEFARKNPGRLDVVIANAGVSLQRSDQLSSDGYELSFQTNHLGHFAFVTALLPLLEKTAREHGEARVVITASSAHAFATSGINFDELQKTKPHRGVRGIGEAMNRYGASKLCNMLFAKELDKRWAAPLRDQGVHVFVDSCHPGMLRLTARRSGTDLLQAQSSTPGWVETGEIGEFRHLLIVAYVV